MSLTRRRFIGQAGALAGGLALTEASGVWAEGEGDTPREARPNILFFFPDQHRYDWVGTRREVGVRTPYLDALGNRGVRFDRAVCASPLCAPSRACLALGVEYDRCGVPSNQEDLSLDRITFYRLLRDAGYSVLGCGKFDLNKGAKEWSLDGKMLLSEWGFSDGINNAGKWDAVASYAKAGAADPYMKYLEDRDLAEAHFKDFRRRRDIDRGQYTATFPTPLDDEAYCDNWVARNGLSLLDSTPRNKPWFLQVNFSGPHPPVDITRSMERSCRDREHPQPFANTQLPASEHTAIRQNYGAMIENIDGWLGRYVEKLAERGELENTLIVFSSDHGEMLGDHDLWGKQHPHQPSVGVPLVVAGPGVGSLGASQARVSVMDLAATFLDYANVEKPAEMESRSIRPVLEGTTDRHRDILYSGVKGFRTAFDGRYKLMAAYPERGQHQLFDLLEDPNESRDLSNQLPEKAKVLLDAIREDLGAPV
jgi:arylsulfatase A-like enzyme